MAKEYISVSILPKNWGGGGNKNRKKKKKEPPPQTTIYEKFPNATKLVPNQRSTVRVGTWSQVSNKEHSSQS